MEFADPIWFGILLLGGGLLFLADIAQAAGRWGARRQR